MRTPMERGNISPSGYFVKIGCEPGLNCLTLTATKVKLSGPIFFASIFLSFESSPAEAGIFQRFE